MFRCTILKCTIFHLPTHANANTWPIPVCPQVGQCMLNDLLWNPIGIHKQVFYLGMPLMSTPKWGCIRMLHQLSRSAVIQYFMSDFNHVIFSHKDTQIAKLKVYYNLALLYLLWVNSKHLECTLKILIFSHKFNEGLCTFCPKKLA